MLSDPTTHVMIVVLTMFTHVDNPHASVACLIVGLVLMRSVTVSCGAFHIFIHAP
jgi:hypothetical protein